jgi:hypothetical protein
MPGIAQKVQQVTRQATTRVGRQKSDFMAGFLMDAETSCIYDKEVRGIRYPIPSAKPNGSPIRENMQPRFEQTAMPVNILRPAGFSKKDFVNFSDKEGVRSESAIDIANTLFRAI